MNRRSLLSLLAASTGLAAIPSWLRGQETYGFGGGHGKSPEEVRDAALAEARAELEAALERAERDLRLLLVIVVPDDPYLVNERGVLFGSWLTHGTDEQLAPLFACELACGTSSDLARVAGDRLPRTEPGDEPLALVFTTRPGTQAIPIPVRRFRRHPSLSRATSLVPGSEPEDAPVETQIAVIAAVVRDALRPWTRLPAPDEVAPWAAEVRRRVGAERPPGALWARTSGCGRTIESPLPAAIPAETVMVACGMGGVRYKAERFLYFLTAAAADAGTGTW